jgi:integrase
MGELKQRGHIWWIRYYRNGRRFEESAKTDKYEKARDMLKEREGDVAKGVPFSPAMGRLKFDEAMTDLETEYTVNKRDSLDHLKRRITLHLKPWFRGRRMTTITTADITAYVEHRQKQDAAAASINRELAILKRAYTLAIRGGKLLPAHRPYIAMLAEHNIRTGFFEAEQFAAVKAKLPAALQPIAEFAYLTGWRVQSEILPLEWRHVDLKAGTVTLDVGSTKNDAGRTLYLTAALRTLLEAQKAIADTFKAKDTIVPFVFHRHGARVKVLYGAWRSACVKAELPGKLLHDLRRTAVRNYVRAGVPERVAMALSGHKTRSVFDRYDIVSPGDLQAAAATLDDVAGTIAGTIVATGTVKRFSARRKR